MFQNLIAANEEFSQEVQRLYKEEELWEQESAKLKKEADEMSKVFEEDLKKVQDKCEDEKKKTVKQIENLIESVRVLTNDNDRLLKEREREKLNSSKSHQVRNLMLTTYMICIAHLGLDHTFS